MADIYQFNETQILQFFLVLVRISAFVFSWPVFGTAQVPTPAKILFSLSLSFMLFPIVEDKAFTYQLSSLFVIMLTMKEAFIGIILGFLAKALFFSVQIASEVIATSMGLASAQLFNPAFGSQITSLAQFKIVLASLFYLAIQGHHLFLKGLLQTFEMIPLSRASISFGGLNAVGAYTQDMMVIGFKLCAPVLVAILFMNVAMAVIGRAVPQINVLITSLPVNTLLGLFVLFIALPLFLWQLQDVLEFSIIRTFEILKTV